jgi:hypothetical protein
MILLFITFEKQTFDMQLSLSDAVVAHVRQPAALGLGVVEEPERHEQLVLDEPATRDR